MNKVIPMHPGPRASTTVLREWVVDLLLAYGWMANRKYLKSFSKDHYDGNDRGFVFGIDQNYLIDPSGRWAVTVKKEVICLYDGNRDFCKVVSMRFREIEFKHNALVVGPLMINLKVKDE